MHAAGVRADAQTFEHIDPARRRQRPRRADLRALRAGARSSRRRARPASPPTSELRRSAIVERVKELEHAGFQFEAADGSFELLMRREAGELRAAVPLESWRVIVEKHADGQRRHRGHDQDLGAAASATCAPPRATARSTRSTARCATRSARSTRTCSDIELVNFKVRILDETKGTGAVTRVLIDASDGHDVWGSIGVSENLIAASWDALVDSLEYGMQPGRRLPERPAQGACAAGGWTVRER